MIPLQWSEGRSAADAFILSRALERARTLFDPYQRSKHDCTGYVWEEIEEGVYIVGREVRGQALGKIVTINTNEQACTCEFWHIHHCCKHQAAMVMALNKLALKEEEAYVRCER